MGGERIPVLALVSEHHATERDALRTRRPAFWDKYAVPTKTREFQVFASAPPYVIMVESLNASLAAEVALARRILQTS